MEVEGADVSTDCRHSPPSSSTVAETWPTSVGDERAVGSSYDDASSAINTAEATTAAGVTTVDVNYASDEVVSATIGEYSGEVTNVTSEETDYADGRQSGVPHFGNQETSGDCPGEIAVDFTNGSVAVVVEPSAASVEQNISYSHGEVMVYGDGEAAATDGSAATVVFGEVEPAPGSSLDYGSEAAAEVKRRSVYLVEEDAVINSVHYSPPQTTSGVGVGEAYEAVVDPMSPRHFAEGMVAHHAMHEDDDDEGVGQCYATASKRLVEMYCTPDDDDESALELPSTTTECADGAVTSVDDPTTSSSILVVKSSPYHQQQHLEEYSPEQRPTSSTGNYSIPMDSFERMSPSTSYHNHHHLHHHNLHSPHDEVRHFATRVTAADDEHMEVIVKLDRSPPNELSTSFGGIVSSSAAAASSSHHSVASVSVSDATSTLIHAEDIRDERFVMPQQPPSPPNPPAMSTVAEMPLAVSQQQHSHHQHHHPHHLIEIEHHHQQQQQQHQHHHLVSLSTEASVSGTHHHHSQRAASSHHHHEVALHDDDDVAQSGRQQQQHHHHPHQQLQQHHSHHHYYDDPGQVLDEPLDPNLVRLVNQRLPTLMGPNMLTDPLQKQLLVESVVRSMMGVQAGRLFLADGVLTDDPGRPPQHIHEDASDGQFATHGGYPAAGQLHLVPLDEGGGGGGIGGGDPAGAEGVLIDHGLIDDQQVAGPSRVLPPLTPHRSREATPPLLLNGSSLSAIPPLSASGGMISTTTGRGMMQDTDVGDSMVQVLDVSEATPAQSFVSSSTGGMEHEHHSLPRHAVILDATVDSTVEMEVAAGAAPSNHRSDHAHNLSIHGEAHDATSGLDHHHVVHQHSNHHHTQSHHNHMSHPHHQVASVATVAASSKYSADHFSSLGHHHNHHNHHHHHQQQLPPAHHHQQQPAHHHLDSAGVSTTAADNEDMDEDVDEHSTLLVAHDPCYSSDPMGGDPGDHTPSSSCGEVRMESESEARDSSVAAAAAASSSTMAGGDALAEARDQLNHQPQLHSGSSSSIADNQVEPLALSRPRRQLAKHRLTALKIEEPFDPDNAWCEKCNLSCNSVCTDHKVRPIFDKPVLTRAWASLPASYLSINKVAIKPSGELVYGVFAKKAIAKRTQFGPLEGVPVANGESTTSPLVNASVLSLQVELEGGGRMTLDVSDESLSNWMRFVRHADNHAEQNLVIVQQGQSLYYTSTTDIAPRTELRVGYSAQYAARRGLPVLEHDDGTREQSQETSWPCFQCNQKFASSVELQDHLHRHDACVDPRRGASANGLGDAVGTAAAIASSSGGVARKVVGKVPGCNKKLTKRVRPRLGSQPKSPQAKNFKTPLDVLSEATSEALYSRKPRGRPPKSCCTNEAAVPGEFECNFCHKKFPRPYSLQRHIVMHSGEKKFKCNVCEMRFTHVYNRNRHMRRHRSMETMAAAKKPSFKLFKRKRVGVNEWLCTHCDLTFNNPSLLNLHTLTHAAEVGLGDEQTPAADYYLEAGTVGSVIVLHECPQCTQAFYSRRELIEHASTHGKLVRKSYRGLINPAKPYKCELCYKSFATEERLMRHMLVHGNEEAKPLKCLLCVKRFLNNSALACHIKVHSDERKFYECPICKEEFDQIVSLKEHIRIHSINGLFTCPHCQKAFDEYNQIRKHIRAFHSEKKFPCAYCDKIFPRPDKLKLHMLRHSTHREFLCANCGKQFKRKDKLKEHMKRMHSAEREARLLNKPAKVPSAKKFIPKVSPNDYHRFIYKCHSCLLGFKRRGMLVNHLAKRHPGIRPESVPELNLPILKTTRDYYCQYCEKVYKSSSKRKAHIIKQHPGADLPMSNRRKGGIPEIPGLPNPTFSQTVGSITTHPQNCEWCHKQYASKAKLLQHQRKKHLAELPNSQQVPRSHHRELKSEEEQVLQLEQQHYVLQQQQQQQLSSDAEPELEYEDGVVGHLDIGDGGAASVQVDVSEVDVDETKHKVMATISAAAATAAGVTSGAVSDCVGGFYVAHQTDDGTVIVSSSDLDGEQVDALPPADLLTQAMSELTQSLVVEYRGASLLHHQQHQHHNIQHQQPHHHQLEYSLDRVTQSCPPAMLVPSPVSTPGPAVIAAAPAAAAATVTVTKVSASSSSQLIAIEQSQLGRLLGHYEEEEAVTVGDDRAQTANTTPTEETDSSASSSTNFVPRSWTTAAYTDFAA